MQIIYIAMLVILHVGLRTISFLHTHACMHIPELMITADKVWSKLTNVRPKSSNFWSNANVFYTYCLSISSAVHVVFGPHHQIPTCTLIWGFVFFVFFWSGCMQVLQDEATCSHIASHLVPSVAMVTQHSSPPFFLNTDALNFAALDSLASLLTQVCFVF